MSALIVGPAQKAQIAKLKAYAEAHPIPLKTLKAAAKDFDPADVTTRKEWTITATAEFNIVLPINISVTFSIEEQPVGMVRHLSVSVAGGHKTPHPALMDTLMGEFGFEHGPEFADAVWLEEFAPGRQAVNVVEVITQGTA